MAESSRTPAHGRRRLMSWRSRRRRCGGLRGGVINTGIEDILVLPAVPVVPLLPGPALRDGFSHVLGLRIVVPEALRRLSGQLLRQRHSIPLQLICKTTQLRLTVRPLRDQQADIQNLPSGFSIVFCFGQTHCSCLFQAVIRPHSFYSRFPGS